MCTYTHTHVSRWGVTHENLMRFSELEQQSKCFCGGAPMQVQQQQQQQQASRSETNFQKLNNFHNEFPRWRLLGLCLPHRYLCNSCLQSMERMQCSCIHTHTARIARSLCAPIILMCGNGLGTIHLVAVVNAGMDSGPYSNSVVLKRIYCKIEMPIQHHRVRSWWYHFIKSGRRMSRAKVFRIQI